ncbi:MAG: CHAP domain-containing protein [Solirubrobacteraceae bacterium]
MSSLITAGQAAAITPGSWPGTSGPPAANSQYGYPYPNAPACTDGGACVTDAWYFFQGQCKSWAAYRLNQLNGVAFSNSYAGQHWGDATHWGAAAQAAGIPVNGSPALGSIAWYSSGHVAYVEEVDSPSQVVISEMNYDLDNGFRVRTITTSSGWPTGFIHIADRSSGGGLPDGSFVSNDGFVYRIAGGAPIYVSNWAAVGGPQPTTSLSDAQFAALPQYPADGTFLNTSTGPVYRVAGGAPMFVSNWSAVGGPQPSVTIDEWDIDNISNPAAHLRPYPADGTFLNTSTGPVYRVAGGAPFAVSSWSVFGGQQPYVTVDQWDIDNIANAAAHLNARPVDGTLVQGLPSHGYWSFSGGLRTSAAAASGAVSVDDVGLAAFPQATCAAGQTGTPPNCQTPPSTCPAGQTGTPPNCQTPPSPTCPAGQTGTPPNCQTPPSPTCPAGQTGTPPNCQTANPAVLRSRCVVPNLKHMTLGTAERALRAAHCGVGTVRRPRHVPRQHVLRVTGQSAVTGAQHSANYPVNITLR